MFFENVPFREITSKNINNPNGNDKENTRVWWDKPTL